MRITQSANFLLIALLFITGCASTTGQNLTLSDRSLDRQKSILAIPADGTACRVSLQPKTSGTWVRESSSTTYVGKIVRTDGEQLLLNAQSREARTSSTNTMLASIPGLERRFKNTGVGTEKLDSKPVWIPLDEIAKIEPLDENSPDIGLAAGN